MARHGETVEEDVRQPVRRLIAVFGDQLSLTSAAFDDLDPQLDVVWMAEVPGEAEHVWSTKPHIAIFLSAMRHFRARLSVEWDPPPRIDYTEMDDPENRGSLGAELRRGIRTWKPESLVLVRPGAWRVLAAVRDATEAEDTPLRVRQDDHFLCPAEEFAEFAEGRKRLIMEHFYHDMRRRTGFLMEDGEPAGGAWNYDDQNRRSFGKEGPGKVPPPREFPPDEITREVLDLVERMFGDHPGGLAHFDWPVTCDHALEALDDFAAQRLGHFGVYEDAMWADEPYLYHSRLSAALNLKLLDPREALRAAEAAYREDGVPLNSVEGFIRQILGWREFVRGIYWLNMPDYIGRNELAADAPLPAFYWSGETDMVCLRQCIEQTMAYGYAHHIQRLMVTGLFALLLGVEPTKVHEWYLAVYVDAVEWVELPNTLGMSQFADGGVMATKPYCASGRYIQRMSNYCAGCRYNPTRRVGEDACPFTTLYWDFLMQHRERLSTNPRMSLQLHNLKRLDTAEQRSIHEHADQVRARVLAS